MLNRHQSGTRSQIYVWDPFVRVFHWTLVAGFAIAYVTEDDLLTVHVWAGYVVGILIVARLIWGLVGPGHARYVWDPFVRVFHWTSLQALPSPMSPRTTYLRCMSGLATWSAF